VPLPSGASTDRPINNPTPGRVAERKRKRQEFGVGAVAALILAGVLSFAVNLQMQGAVSDQNERNQFLKDEIAKLDKQIAEIQQLDQQKQRLLARMQVIEQLERSRPEVVHLFDQLVRTLPDGVYLTAVKQNERKVQLKGIAQSSTRVSSYMRNIDASEWLADPSLDILENKGNSDSGSEFTLNAQQENLQLPPSEEQAVAARGSQR